MYFDIVFFRETARQKIFNRKVSSILRI